MALSDFPLHRLTRRSVLQRLAAGPLLACVGRALAQKSDAHKDPFGPIAPPQPLPAIELTTHAGASTDLAALTRGKVSALQLIFTRCRATCPILGSTFAAARKQLGAGRDDAQWLSISIDPKADTPGVLSAWLAKHAAGKDWIAASPSVEGVDVLFDALRGRATGADRHTTSIYFIDRRSELVYRTADLPASRELASLMRTLIDRSPSR